MKELVIAVLLANAQNGSYSESEVQQKVLQSQIQQNVQIGQMVDIDTTGLTVGRQLQCWTSNVYNSQGQITTKVQCQ